MARTINCQLILEKYPKLSKERGNVAAQIMLDYIEYFMESEQEQLAKCLRRDIRAGRPLWEIKLDYDLPIDLIACNEADGINIPVAHGLGY